MDGAEAYDEDKWEQVKIGSFVFKVLYMKTVQFFVSLKSNLPNNT